MTTGRTTTTPHERMDRRIAVAITGATGAIYAERLLALLVERVSRVYVIWSECGQEVIRHELAPHEGGSGQDDAPRFSLRALAHDGRVPEPWREIVRIADNRDFFAPIASGTSAPTDMVIVPASMGTLARVTHGISSSLIERAADVVLKEKRRLVLVPREMPLSPIHLRNMLQLAEMGATILPASPGFYQRPRSMDDLIHSVVGKILEAIDLSHNLYRPWNDRMS